MPQSSPSLSLPNMLTVGRILAIPVIVLLIFSGVPLLRWLALILFIVAAITDLFDGLLARMLGQTSDLGRMLDPIADKLLVAALLLTFAFDRSFTLFDLIPAFAILLREIFIAGLREFLGERQVVLHVSLLAKYKTTIQLIALGLVLAEPLLPGIRYIADAGLWIAAILTVWTGYSYWQAAWPHFNAAPVSQPVVDPEADIQE